LKEDVEACRRGGMDVCLTKPLEPRKLHAQLLRVAGQKDAGHVDVPPTGNRTPEAGRPETGRPETDTKVGQLLVERARQKESTTMNASAIGGPSENFARLLEERGDLVTEQVIDFRAAASRLPGGWKGVRRLAEVFTAECQSLMQVLEREIPEGDAASIQRAAHTLKGSANLFFAKQVYDAAFRIEDNVRQKRFDGIESDYIRLRQCVQVLLKEIRQFLEITAE